MECPCCSGRPFDQCCGPLLAGEAQAGSPEALMRSRYTAYARGDFDYILATTDPQRRYDFDHDVARAWMRTSTFTGLKVLAGSEEGNKGVVEFIASFRRNGGREEKHRERSLFRKQGGRWFYRPERRKG
ncbi:YchJ family protein [Blastochloris sulfoviridis]|uniref:Zinc chelation protein SecC n=1 Tax=Blastochloris sulfoviridis TaxID=50712 RepID=A0A5M6HK89_9HYPH|nr:YchJ family metal-binding protein [Blastochloris sulfoviridis]KAA5596244.1 zinc chelation protein SecC [Blastochloris sulfoviridis]